MNRDNETEKIRTRSAWDLVVIRVGATGLGTALEAATRGYKVLLLEQSDFAKSTSSKSTKLVHGGVRYLVHGDVALVREASVERGLLVKNAPHLVKNPPFIIPLYSWWDRIKYTAGLRPLAAPQGEGQKTKEISRSHKIIVSTSGLFTILGGKWTTYRKMGEDLVDKIEQTLRWNKTATRNLKIHGYQENVDWNDPLYFYGADAASLKELVHSKDAWISEKLQIHTAQVVWAVREEMAPSVEDVLSRRTRAILLDARESLRVAPLVADTMAALLGKDAAWKKIQLADFKSVCQSYLPEHFTIIKKDLAATV